MYGAAGAHLGVVQVNMDDHLTLFRIFVMSSHGRLLHIYHGQCNATTSQCPVLLQFELVHLCADILSSVLRHIFMVHIPCM